MTIGVHTERRKTILTNLLEMPRNTEPRRLLRKAVEAIGLSDRQFADSRLVVRVRTLRY